MYKLPIMTNKEYQALGTLPMVVATYLLDDLGERIRKLPEGSEEHSKYNPKDIEVVVKKPLTRKEIYLDFDPAPY